MVVLLVYGPNLQRLVFWKWSRYFLDWLWDNGAGGVFDELASLGPDFLKDIIDNKYSDSTSKYSTVVISKISRIDELCDLLCLDLNWFGKLSRKITEIRIITFIDKN